MPTLTRRLGLTGIFALLCTLIVLPGCFKLSRGAPIQQHFILGAADQGGPPRAMAVSNPLVVGLRLPRLADYLASPFVVVRRGANRIEYSDLDRWGEDLARGINRRLAGQMAQLAPSSRFDTAPWPMGAVPDQIVQLQILRFEGVVPEGTGTGQTGEAHFHASWEVFRSGDNVLLTRGVTEVRTPGWMVGDFGALVGMLDVGIGTLAEEILTELEATLVRERAPPPP